jgi:hypothetical protein
MGLPGYHDALEGKKMHLRVPGQRTFPGWKSLAADLHGRVESVVLHLLVTLLVGKQAVDVQGTLPDRTVAVDAGLVDLDPGVGVARTGNLIDATLRPTVPEAYDLRAVTGVALLTAKERLLAGLGRRAGGHAQKYG